MADAATGQRESDEAAVRDYLSRNDMGWRWGDEYVAEVVEEIAVVRAGYGGDGLFDPPTHGIEEAGACVHCDARRIFMDDLIDD